jgi:hypothetical protein
METPNGRQEDLEKKINTKNKKKKNLVTDKPQLYNLNYTAEVPHHEFF